MKLNYLVPAFVAAGTAVLAASSFAPANAAFTITAGGSTPGDGSFLTTSNSNATVVNFNSGLPLPSTPYQYTGGSIVGPGTTSGSFAQPLNDTTRYYSVGPSTSEPGTIVTLNGLQKYFGLYWGSIDDYNTISFYDGSTLLNSYSGTQIAAELGLTANGGQGAVASNAYINFSATAGSYFNSIVFNSSGTNAFESDNHAFQAVPEPLTLLGSGIALGFGAHLKRKLNGKQKKALT